MFKKLLLVGLCINMSGCMYQDLDNIEIRKALHFCKSADNIEWVSSFSLGNGSVRCVSGEYSILGKIEIKEPSK